jgi:GNAT superfamily N-acetyltransferase
VSVREKDDRPSLPPGYRTRPPRRSDVAAIAAVAGANDTAVSGESDVTEAEIAFHWDTPRYDPEHDALVVEADDGTVVGYRCVSSCQDHLQIDAYLVVHPEHWRRGLEPFLLTDAEARAVELAAAAQAGARASLGVWCFRQDEILQQLFRAAGFAPTRVFQQMTIDAAAIRGEPRWPAGIEVRLFRRGVDE